MRVTFAVTMALFLAPTVYVIKYYSVDKPAEEAYIRQLMVCSCTPSLTMNSVAYWERQAADAQAGNRMPAIHALGVILHFPNVGIKRPLECLSAKATLSDIAVHAKDPAARAAASEELGRVAQGGAVIRR